MHRISFGLSVLSVLASTLSVAADDSAQFRRALDSARKFMFARHLLAEVVLEPRGGSGPKEEFKYDRYPDVERIKLGEGEVFAKKKGSRWLKSDDWGETGTPVSAKKSKDLEYRVRIALIAWNTSHSSKDKTQGRDVTKLVSRSKDELGEHLVFELTREHPTQVSYPRYIFTKYFDEPLIDQFSGPILIGDKKLFLTVRYTAFIEIEKSRIKIEPLRNP